jgi:hypothetical protein
MALNPLVQQLIGADGLIAPQKPKDLFASMLIKGGLDSSPVGHWTQGAARVAQALLGGLELRGQDADENSRKAAPDEIAGIAGRYGMGGAAPQAAPMPQAMPQSAPSMPPSQSPPPMMAAPAQSSDPNMSLPNSVIQNANPASFNDRFSAAFPPANAPVQAQGGAPSPLPPAPMGPMAQAPMGQPSMPQGGPNLMAAAEEMRKSKNPYTKAIGTQVMMQEILRSPEYEIKVDGAVTTAIDKKNPRNRFVFNDPQLAQAIIQNKAQEQYATTTAEGRAKKDLAAPEKARQQERSGGIVIQDIDRALTTVNRPGLPSTGAIGAIAKNIPGTNAFDVSELMNSIKSNAAFDRLQAMREASPTGGALGGVAVEELRMLQAAIGSLEQSQGKPQFEDNLRRVKNIYLDVIHGQGNGPAREKLTFEQGAQGAQGGQSPVSWQQYFGKR